MEWGLGRGCTGHLISDGYGNEKSSLHLPEKEEK